jgi:hypothetical protein
MFEHGLMSPAVSVAGAPGVRADIRALQQRIQTMQAAKVDYPVFPVSETLHDLFPEGGLRRGAVYQLDSSASLLWSLLAEASSRGVWCALVGMPDVGLAAGEEMGVNLDRLVVVPFPGQQWLPVVGALIDVVGIVALGSVPAPSDRALSSLTGRLREREATLLVRHAWPRTEASIAVRSHRWQGLGAGHGLLHEHHVSLTLTPRHGHPERSCDIVIDAWGTQRDVSSAQITDITTRREAG